MMPRRLAVIVVVFAVGVAIAWALRPTYQDGAARSSANFEEWVEEVAKTGSGIVRAQVDGGNGQPGATTRDDEYRSAGPLSGAGLKQISSFARARLADLERQIEALPSEPIDMMRELELLITYEEWVVAREHIDSGRYLTIPEGQAAPSTPRNCQEFVFSPHPLESGGVAQVFLVVDRSLHKGLRDICAQYSSLAEDARRLKMAQFNERPLPERRSWVADYVSLREKVRRVGRLGLTSDELSAWLSKTQMLRGLRAEVSEYNEVLIPAIRASR